MGEACDSGTNLALPSLRHQSRRGGREWEPGLVACAVEPGTLDLVVTGQGSVTIPPVYESRVPRDFPLVGDETPQVLGGVWQTAPGEARAAGQRGRLRRVPCCT